MANKYIIEGATYNGDGTTSSEAASAGAAGAWNHVNIITGTAVGYGSIAAGDTINIRSKTSAGADITINGTCTIGLATGTLAAPLKWILDGGTIWSGINGIFTFYADTSTYVWTLKEFNILIAEVYEKIVFDFNVADPVNKIPLLVNGHLENALVDYGAKTGTYSLGIGTSMTGYFQSKMRTCHVIEGKPGSSGLFSGSAYGTLVLENVDIEKQYATATATPTFLPWQFGGKLVVRGGRLRGAGAIGGNYVCGIQNTNSNTSTIDIVGMAIPKTMDWAPMVSGVNNSLAQIKNGIALDGGVGGVSSCYHYLISSRDDGNFPTLNATLPDSVATPWSWYVYPKYASEFVPVSLSILKLFTDTAAAETITLEFLANDAFGEINKGNLWIDIIYIDDSTGLPVFASTRDAASGALSTSTASWSATTYGVISLNKKKIAITTATSIKKDTGILVFFNCAVGSADSSDIFFVCPDVQLT